jgi:hypothetical protein
VPLRQNKNYRIFLFIYTILRTCVNCTLRVDVLKISPYVRSGRPCLPNLTFQTFILANTDIDKKEIRLLHENFLSFSPVVPSYICRKRPEYIKAQCGLEIRMIKSFSRMVKKIGTHNGHFHADEVLACVLLVRLSIEKIDRI